jgi:hypothetical protein
MSPHVLPCDDGDHFWWFHDCWDYLGENGARRDRETETLLPLGPNGWQYCPASNSVTPSILCYRCGTHGFWTVGRWHPA